jgi:hypothetical protein
MKQNIYFYIEINDDFYRFDGNDSKEILFERIMFENNEIKYTEDYISINKKELKKHFIGFLNNLPA